MKVIIKENDPKYLKVDTIVNNKPIFQIQQNRQSHLHQLIQKQRNVNSVQFTQPLTNSLNSTYRYNFSPYLRANPMPPKQTLNTKGKGFRSQNQSPQQTQMINFTTTNNISKINPQQHDFVHLSQSLNGSFELFQRRQKSNQEKLTKLEQHKILPIKSRAKSVADDQRQEISLQIIKKAPPSNQLCKMDSETSFEGYRQDGPRFLTMQSQDEENEKILDDFTVKDFLNSKPMSKMMIEHFMNNLKTEQIQLVDRLVKFRKKSIGSQDNNTKLFKKKRQY